MKTADEATLMLAETDGTLLISASVFKHLHTSKSVGWFWAVQNRTGPDRTGCPVSEHSKCFDPHGFFVFETQNVEPAV